MATLEARQAIRQRMMAGDVEAVNKLIQQHCPELVVSKGGTRPDLDVYFYVNCMQFIELIRCMQQLCPGHGLQHTCCC